MGLQHCFHFIVPRLEMQTQGLHCIVKKYVLSNSIESYWSLLHSIASFRFAQFPLASLEIPWIPFRILRDTSSSPSAASGTGARSPGGTSCPAGSAWKRLTPFYKANNWTVNPRSPFYSRKNVFYHVLSYSIMFYFYQTLLNSIEFYWSLLPLLDSLSFL